MRRFQILTVVAVILVLAAPVLASSIPDPSGIIRSGYSYDTEAIVGPGFTLTFNDVVFTSFNPFTADFCNPVAAMGNEPAGVECDFENQSGQTISNLNQVFASSFTGDNLLTCANEINPEAGCDAGINTLGFNGLGIPFTSEEYFASPLLNTNTDPDFNILYVGFTQEDALILNTSFVPEPGSLSLFLGGILGLGLGIKRRCSRR